MRSLCVSHLQPGKWIHDSFDAISSYQHTTNCVRNPDKRRDERWTAVKQQESALNVVSHNAGGGDRVKARQSDPFVFPQATKPSHVSNLEELSTLREGITGDRGRAEDRGPHVYLQRYLPGLHFRPAIIRTYANRMPRLSNSTSIHSITDIDQDIDTT